jgi:hypothetical protein
VGRDNILSVDGIHVEPNNPFATLRFDPKPFLSYVIIVIIKVPGTPWTTAMKRTANSFKGLFLLQTKGCCRGDGIIRREGLQGVSVLFKFW